MSKTISVYEAFENLVTSLYDHPTNNGKRLGQIYFNVLSEVRPDVSEQIRGTMFDPFHMDIIPSKISDVVRGMWEQNTSL